MALTPVFSDVQSAVQSYVIPKVHDITYRDTDLVTMYWLNKNCRKEQRGGEYVEAPILDVRADDSVQLTNGNELISTDKITEFDKVRYPWHARVKPVVGWNKDIEVVIGNSPARVFDYWVAKTKAAAKSLRYKVASDILTNTTVSAGYLVGLRTIACDYTTGSITAYGGITIGAAGDVLDTATQRTETTLSLGAMEALWVACNNKTQIVITTAAQFAKFWALLTPQQRYTDTDTAKAGFRNLMFNTAPVVMDTMCSTGYMYFLSAGSADEKYLYYFVNPDWDFGYKAIAEELPNQEVRLGRFRYAAQLLCPGRRYQGCFSALA